jgi:DNA-binding NarL/FixJ family response regulator
MKTRVVLVDDHHVFRHAFAALLDGTDDIEVVGQASSGREALALLETVQPDVAVFDLVMPGGDGISTLRQLSQRHPGPRALILTAYAEEDYVERAFAAGASGYAVKSQGIDEVLDAIRIVGRGGRYLAPGLPEPLPEPGRAEEARGPLERLSARERQIFDLVVRGLSNTGISRELCISVKTVETHRASVNRKLGVHSSAQLLRFAALRGLVLE